MQTILKKQIQNCLWYPFKTVKGTFIKKAAGQNDDYPTDDSDGSDFSSDAETLPSGSASQNNNHYSNRKKKKIVEKSGK